MIVPVADRLHKVNMQIVTMAVPAQEGITRDNVTVKVDAVVYFRVDRSGTSGRQCPGLSFAVSQVAQTSLRSVIGKSDLDDLLTNRERLNEGLELMIDNPAVEWGIHIDRVEIKDVALPETMKRSMSRQAEAERERRARVISAEGELQASDRLAQRRCHDGRHAGRLLLRLLETIVEVAAEKNSTWCCLHRAAAIPGNNTSLTSALSGSSYSGGQVRCRLRNRPLAGDQGEARQRARGRGLGGGGFWRSGSVGGRRRQRPQPTPAPGVVCE